MADKKQLEKAKDLIKLGVSVENAVKYAGGDFSEEEKSVLNHCEFVHKVDKEASYEKQLDELIKEQIERGVGTALLWALEHKIPKYAAKSVQGGDIHIHVEEGDFKDISEEGDGDKDE